MAASGSFQRGGKPRSVPDIDAPAYAAAIARQKAYNARQAANKPANQEEFWDTHPGVVESLFPVWGSAREAIADYREGDKIGAAANGAMAVLDLTGEGFVLNKLGRTGLKVAGSHTWNATSKWLRKDGRNFLAKGQDGHHWAIPQNDWGKFVPDAIKNQAWNITPMTSRLAHIRIHNASRVESLPRFNVVERYLYGTPDWWKVQNALWVAHGAVGAEEGANPKARDDRAPPAARPR